MIYHALNPPEESMLLPYTKNEPSPTYCWASTYIKPVVCPGLFNEINKPFITKRMDIRFFVPASFISVIGFLDQVYANGGNPYCEDLLTNSPENHCGITSIIILAPHLS